MIDPKEMRLGNLVKIPDFTDPQQVAAVFREDLGFDIPLDDISTTFNRIRMAAIDPIPITPEWLERVGFDKYGRLPFEMSVNKNIWVSWINEDEGWMVDIHGEPFVLIRYVHQLQNLIFALTGSELTIKETTETK